MESKAIDNFLKGLVSRPADDKIADNSFSDCMNIDLAENFLPKSIKGKIKVNSSLLADKPCMGMTIYNNKELGSIMVVACGGYVWYSPLNTDNFQKYQIDNNGTLEDVVIDENVRVRFAQYNDRLFVFTGKYPVIENEDFDDACILVLYKNSATYINRDSFYAWSSSGQIFYTLSATPTNGDVIFTDLYRSKLTATVASYDSGTDKFIDSDNAEYSRTTSSDKADNNIPKGLKIGFIHQERLFGLGSIEDDNGVYWSQPYDPTRWTPIYGLNYDTVGKDDGEKITGGASFGGAYVYVFKQHNVYRYLTSGDIDQWASNKVDTTYGCVAHETIRLFSGLLTYLSPDGVAQLNGNSAVLIDEQIKDKTTNVSVGNDVQIERSYTKKDNWSNAGATTKGIVANNNKISTIHDFNKNLFNSEKESVGQYLDCEDNSLKCAMRTDFESTAASDDTKNILSWNRTGGSETIKRGFCFKIEPRHKNWTLSDVQIYITSKSYTNAKDGYVFLQLRKDNYNGTVVATTANKSYSDISTNAYNSFNFSNFVMEANTTYWVCGNGGASAQTSSIASIFTVKLATYYCAGDGYYNDTLQNASPLLKYNTNIDLNDYTFKSDEIDLQTTNFNLQQLIKTTLAGQSYNNYSVKISVASYPDSSNSWDSIDNAYITDYTLTQNSSDTININNSSAYRFLRFKIEFTAGLYGVSNLFFKVQDSYIYESEPIQITGITDLPKGWGTSEIVQTGTDDVANKATVYMRSGNDVTELSNATFYEINNNEQISASVGLKCLVQFKVVFPEGSDNEVSSIKILYYSLMSITKVCAFVWKDKYRLNMPANNESSDNAVEYIYDKDGYWVIKDNETNFDYCASVNDLFACSQFTGTIYKKETGYKNDSVSYDSYFVTKRFVLSDFENLYRKFKVRYVSASVDITIGVSVDDGDFVNYTITKNTNLIEVIRTLTGIVRGQSIRFKFSWQANDSTQIHNVMWYWTVLRQLNIG